MTITVVVMILLGIAFVIASFIISEKIGKSEDNKKIDLMTVDENYEFSDRELQIIKRKIEDVIAEQAKDILYQTNESLSNMANEKTMALGDYAVAVCDEIENNHKQVMFLYSMLDDKQKEIMNVVKAVDSSKKEINEVIERTKDYKLNTYDDSNKTSSEEQLMQTALNNIDDKSYGNTDRKAMDRPANVFNNAADQQDDGLESVDTVAEQQFDNVDSLDETLDDIFAEIDQTDINFDEVLEKDFKNDANANDIILEMYNNGNSIIEIAKEMGLGVGEVKLVIDLYQGV